MDAFVELASAQVALTFAFAGFLAAIGLVLVWRGEPSAWPEDDSD